MTVQNIVNHWKDIASNLTSIDAGMGLVQSHPPTGKRLSLLDSMRDPEIASSSGQRASGLRHFNDLDNIIRQFSMLERFSRCPILGITGILNSGKSSLLATYLSPTGRGRVLTGLSNACGTHRFILWLPTRWRDQNELLETLVEFLQQLFGHAPEALSEDPELAAQQYNGQLLSMTCPNAAALSVPLLAFDSGLDKLCLGLLDCPDIQTGYWSSDHRGRELASLRQHQLASVGRLCSAFVVLTRLNSLHDNSLIDVLTTLRDAMPGVTRLLAVNRVKARYSPEIVANEAQTLIDRFAIRSLFMAYDYRSSLAVSCIPPAPSGLVADPDRSPQPIFFEVATQQGRTGKGQTSDDCSAQPLRYLYHLAEQLDSGILAEESCRSLALQLKTRSQEALQWHRRNADLRRQQISDAHSTLAQACYQFLAQRDDSGAVVGLRLQASPAVIAQISASLHRTAPLWLRPSLAIDRGARQLQQAVSGRWERLRLLNTASKSVLEFVSRFRRGEGAQVMTPERLSHAIREGDKQDSLLGLSDDLLQTGCQRALERFAAEEKTELDQAALDQWSQAVWRQMNWKSQLRRGLQPLALTTAPLLAALLIPFDGGGTAVLVFASAQELLAAAGIAAVLTPVVGGGETLKIIQEETPWRQMSNLFSILCDCLVLPRPDAANLPHCGLDHKPLAESTLPVRLPSDPSKMPLWQPDDGALSRLQTALDQLS